VRLEPTVAKVETVELNLFQYNYGVIRTTPNLELKA